MRNESLVRRIYDFSIKHFIITAIILTIPSFYFLLIQVAGEYLGIITKDGVLTSSGKFIFWPLFFISVILVFFKTIADKYNEMVKNNGQFVLQKMLASVNSAKSMKFRRFVDYIDNNHNENSLDPFYDITQPKLQIENLLENIRITLSEIFDIKRDEIGLSILYKTDKDRKWKWLHTINIENDLTISELIGNPNTSAAQIVNKKVKSLFYPDKRVGVREGKYVEGQKDKFTGGIGSVISHNISIESSNIYLLAILNITTYGKQLCAQNDQDSISKIMTILLPCFEVRIKLELSLLYIKEVMYKHEN